MSALVICPSRGRPNSARELLESFELMRRDKATRLVFVVDADDATRADYPGDVYVVKPTGSYAAGVNAAVRDAAVIRDATSVGFVGDDNRFRTAGFDVVLDGYLSTNIGIAYPDDGFQHERLPTSWWLSRPIADRFGLAMSGFRHFFVDDVWRDLGQDAKCLRYFGEVLVEHLHPLAGKGEQDAVYERSGKHAAHDRLAYQRWTKRSRKRDAAVLRSMLNRSDVKRVLADWHHPALWESLEMLFSDRFGWQLYSMTGTEWKRNGWRFEHNSTPADWYLSRPARAVADHFEIASVEYPERPRKAVTVAQADAMRFDYVLGSVAVHQRPFSDLANKLGARFVHQVGNKVHHIDRTVPQIILASSQIRERGAVVYHQEFDRSLFAYREPQHSGVVASFMLRPETAGCDRQWLVDGLRDCFRDYGHEIDATRYVAPMTAVADAMSAADFIWHDKRIGDGYGHVLHNAAALGRPLIGHGAHFKRLLGEPFWVDMQTCVDLDKHSQIEALRLVKAISRDPDWLTDMSQRIAAVFDATVDFDAEAERVREALA